MTTDTQPQGIKNTARLLVLMVTKFIIALLAVLAFLLIASWLGSAIAEADEQYQIGQDLIIIEHENDIHDHWNKDN